jgi:hypothetical protein
MLSNGKRCACCGRPAVCEHHLIRRGASEILRFDPLNGLELCQECHDKIHAGKLDEWSLVSKDRAEKLHELSRVHFKDYLLNMGGWTPDEYYRSAKERLKKTILREDDLCGFVGAFPSADSAIPF